jgi:branched-chain amino acid aminotransferase
MTWSEDTGAWSEPTLESEPYIKVHIGATALHYGQACFEGLKAFAHDDSSVHLFRPTANANRLRSSAKRTVMPELTDELFLSAARTCVAANMGYVPPASSNGALYLRPLLFGSGPRIGLQPSGEYKFVVLATPVGDYYKGGLSPVRGKVVTEYDRAAPRGVGAVKVAGNYAADLLPNIEGTCARASGEGAAALIPSVPLSYSLFVLARPRAGKADGFPILLYLDSATQSVVEEFSTSNFIGINREKVREH